MAQGLEQVSLRARSLEEPTYFSLGEGAGWQSGLGGLCLAPRGPGNPRLLPGELPTSPNTIPDSSAWRMAEKLLHQ